MRTTPSRAARAAAAVALVLSAVSLPATAQSPDPVARARALVESKDAAGAYSLLAPLAGARAGEVEFDYWLGVAALETGRIEIAALAFERALDRNPDFDSARLELGRTYLRMGSLDLAELEFRRLLERSPNEAGRKLLDGYLAEIRRLKERQAFSVTGFVEAGGGHDSNLSSTTSDFTSAVESSFGLPGITPTGNSIKRSAPYWAAAAGVNAAYRAAEDLTWFGSAEGRVRGYQGESDYDWQLLDASGGVQWRRGENTYTAFAFGQVFRQDGAAVETIATEQAINNDRDAWGALAEVRRDLDAATQVAAGVQLSAFRYRTNPAQDTDQAQVFAAIVNRPGWWKGGTVSLLGQYSYDDARRTLNDFTELTASRHGGGFRLMAHSDPSARFSWSAYAAWTVRIDNDPYARATLVATGRDVLHELGLRASWRLADGWYLQPNLAYVRNRSNIDLYDFDKLEGGVVLRREFE
ncbi:MAG: tetratricopeptide repeat protein [Burkholderiales bacterium]|nr:tetratricopeptide repeat protein [Burkholderiales bacterium]